MSQPPTTPSAPTPSTGPDISDTSHVRRSPQHSPGESGHVSSRLVVGIVCAVLAVAVAVGVIVYALNSNSRQDAAPLTPPNANPQGTGIIANPGKASGQVPTLVVYQDYQCPACAYVESVIGQPLNSLADQGKITLEYRTMTFLDTNLRNDASQRAAVAAACADTVGHYRPYHDTVFANQPTTEGTGFTDQQLRADFATQAGMSEGALTSFQQCYDHQRTDAFVQSVDRAAGQAGITGTPTLLVNGKPWDLGTVTSTDEAALLQAITALAGN